MNLNKKYNQIVSSVKMTHDEKNAMRSSLVWHVRSNHKPVKSHFYNIPWVRYGMAFAFLMLVSGSGVSFASQNALPGDLSYSWKIQIEEIKGITKTTPKKKLIYSKERAQIRLTEMKTLLANTATTSEKTAENIAIASKELESHIKDAKDNAIIIAESANDADQKEALIEVKNLETSIASDVRVIAALAYNKIDSDTNNGSNTALTDAITKNKDSITEAVKDIALPKKSETDQLDTDVSNIETGLDTEDIPAGTGADRLGDEKDTIPQAE